MVERKVGRPRDAPYQPQAFRYFVGRFFLWRWFSRHGFFHGRLQVRRNVDVYSTPPWRHRPAQRASQKPAPLLVLQPIYLLKFELRLAFIREAHHVASGRLVFQFSRFDALELVFVCDGKRVIGYDDERGKGDHGHLGKKRMP